MPICFYKTTHHTGVHSESKSKSLKDAQRPWRILRAFEDFLRYVETFRDKDPCRHSSRVSKVLRDTQGSRLHSLPFLLLVTHPEVAESKK